MTIATPTATPAAAVSISPLLARSGAVAATGADVGIAWHYGDPLGEQRTLARSAGVVDRSNRGVLVVPGADRLSWLHSICSQHVSGLRDGESARALVLSPHGHVEQDWQVTELGDRVWLDVEPGTTAMALDYLQKMRFMKRVEPADVSADFAVLGVVGPAAPEVLGAASLPVPAAAGQALGRDGGGFVRANGADDFDVVVPRPELARVAGDLLAAGGAPVGAWAAAAHRVERRRPRLGFETDHRTIPHEIGLIGVAVHLDKGCYRGQETVARVQNLGQPPRRLVLLHLSGESDELPDAGTAVERDGRTVGFLGTAVHHHELGPIALAVIKRTLPDDAELLVAGHTAAIDPGPAAHQTPHRDPRRARRPVRAWLRLLAECLQLLALTGTVVTVIVDGLKEQARRVGSIGEFIREQRELAQVSVRQLAALAGVSNPYLSQIERGLRKPSAEILQQIAKGLQISAEQLYVRAGILEARDGDPETIAAILADSGLAERQKHVLVEIYQSFRRENQSATPSADEPADTQAG